MSDQARQAGRFAGRSAIVTGGASGIGLDVAARLTAEGAAVSLWDMNEAALAEARRHTGAIHARALDITDAAAVEAAMADSLAALGNRLDVLVCSAGITGPNATVRDYPVEAWRRVIDVNLTGLVLRHRRPAGRGQGAGLHRRQAAAAARPGKARRG